MIAGVLLAAGAGRRFGGEKLGALVDGRAVVYHAARALRDAVDEMWVIVAPNDRVVRAALAKIDAHVVVNERAAQGSSTSIAAGIAALPPDVDGAFVALGDQPRIPDGVYGELLRVYRAGDCDIVAPIYRGVQANPVLFSRRVFPELIALEGDAGARSVVMRDPTRLQLVAIDASVPSDIDRPADLDRLRRE